MMMMMQRPALTIITIRFVMLYHPSSIIIIFKHDIVLCPFSFMLSRCPFFCSRFYSLARVPLTSPINFARNCANGFSNYVCYVWFAAADVCEFGAVRCSSFFPISFQIHFHMTGRPFFACSPHIKHILAISPFVVLVVSGSLSLAYLFMFIWIDHRRFLSSEKCLHVLVTAVQTKIRHIQRTTQCNNCNIACTQFLNHKKIIIFLILFPYRVRPGQPRRRINKDREKWKSWMDWRRKIIREKCWIKYVVG